MKMNISHLLTMIILIVLVFQNTESIAQEVPLSQYFASPVQMNPALVGSSSHPLVIVHHRSQLNSFTNNSPINIASFIYPIIRKYPRRFNQGGLGLTLLREVNGIEGWLTSNEIQVSGAYNLPINFKQRHVLSFGVATAYRQRSIEPGKIQWGSQYDSDLGYVSSITPSVTLLNQRIGYASMQAGMIWSYNTFKNQLLNAWQWTSGVTVAQMNRPNASFTSLERRLPISIKWYGGASYTHYNWKINPQILILKQEKVLFANIGSYLEYRLGYHEATQQNTLLMGGLWYRWNDAFAVSGGIVHRHIQFALSVDFSQYPTFDHVSPGNAWEASIVYTITNHTITTKRRSTPLI